MSSVESSLLPCPTAISSPSYLEVKTPLLLLLPNEILLRIFHQAPTIEDACSLARSCTQLYALFTSRRNKINILRSAAHLPRKPDYGLDKAFSTLTRMPPLNWCIQGDEAYSYVFTFDYTRAPKEGASHSMWNLKTFCDNPQLPAFQDALHEFLAQFHQLPSRWSENFGRVTKEILSAASQLQTDILSRSSVTPSDLSTESTVIALAFHCLVVLRDIDLINGRYMNNPERELAGEGLPVVIEEASWDGETLVPYIEIRKEKKRDRLLVASAERKPGFDLDSGPEAMLDYIAQLSFQLLDRQDPRNWPTVLHVLLILVLTRVILQPWTMWMCKIEKACESLDPLLSDLARYYYVSTNGGQIISPRWNEENYNVQVGGDEIAIKHSRILRRFWLETGERGEFKRNGHYKGLDGFLAKLELFAYGFVAP